MVALIYNCRFLEDAMQHRLVKSVSLKLLTSVGSHYIKGKVHNLTIRK